MKKVLGLLGALLLITQVVYAQFSFLHKSEAQIARMRPEQRVKEYARHYYDEHYEYLELLSKCIYQDGLKALPAIAQELDSYNPAAMRKWDLKRAKRHQAAHHLLSDIDNKVFRVRGFAEGKRAVEAAERATRRLADALATKGNDLGENSDDLKIVHDLAASFSRGLLGRNSLDAKIRDTLWFKYDVDLSENDLLSFVEYLIAKDPYYPSHVKPKLLTPPGIKKGSDRIIQSIVNKPEAIHQLYQEYKARRSQ
jgi:hypothetical protein